MTVVYYLRGGRKQGGFAALLSPSHLSDARHCEGSARSNLWLSENSLVEINNLLAKALFPGHADITGHPEYCLKLSE